MNLLIKLICKGSLREIPWSRKKSMMTFSERFSHMLDLVALAWKSILLTEDLRPKGISCLSKRCPISSQQGPSRQHLKVRKGVWYKIWSLSKRSVKRQGKLKPLAPWERMLSLTMQVNPNKRRETMLTTLSRSEKVRLGKGGLTQARNLHLSSAWRNCWNKLT